MYKTYLMPCRFFSSTSGCDCFTRFSSAFVRISAVYFIFNFRDGSLPHHGFWYQMVHNGMKCFHEYQNIFLYKYCSLNSFPHCCYITINIHTTPSFHFIQRMKDWTRTSGHSVLLRIDNATRWLQKRSCSCPQKIFL